MIRTDDLATSEELLEIFDGGHDPDTEDILTSGRVPVCDGEWRREPDGRWRFWRHRDSADDECEHTWQPHDVYGENCTKCEAWRDPAQNVK